MSLRTGHSSISSLQPACTILYPKYSRLAHVCLRHACSVIEELQMFFGASLSWNDILFMLNGAITTITITLASVAIGTGLGVLFGLVRAGSPWWVSWPVGGILDLFRSVPLLIQLVCSN